MKRFAMSIEFGHADAVLARQLMQLAELGIDFCIALRVEIERALVSTQRIDRFIDMDTGGIEQFAQWLHGRVECGQALALPVRASNQARNAELALAIQQVGKSGTTLQELPGVGQPAVGLLKFAKSLDGQGMRIEFLDLMDEPFDALGMILAARNPADAAFEQGELLAAFEQGLMLVLSVNLDQAFAEGFHLGQGDRSTVDPGTRRAFAADHAPQLAGAVVIEFLLAQPCQKIIALAEIEFSRQLGALATMTDQAGFSTIACQQEQGIDEQRLAGTGFAGDDGQPGAKSDFSLADDGEILDVKRTQHAAPL